CRTSRAAGRRRSTRSTATSRRAGMRSGSRRPPTPLSPGSSGRELASLHHGSTDARARRARRDLRPCARHAARRVLRSRRRRGRTATGAPLHQRPGSAARRRPGGVSARRRHRVYAGAEGAARRAARGRAAGRAARGLLPLAPADRGVLLGRGPGPRALRRRAGVPGRHLSRRRGCPHGGGGACVPLGRGGPRFRRGPGRDPPMTARSPDLGATVAGVHLAFCAMNAPEAFSLPHDLRRLVTSRTGAIVRRMTEAAAVPVAVRLPERTSLPYARVRDVLADAAVRIVVVRNDFGGLEKFVLEAGTTFDVVAVGGIHSGYDVRRALAKGAKAV